MARGTTLGKLLDYLRAEARLSQTPAHTAQTRPSHVIMLQREQERLWEDYYWPHLRVERLVPLSAGQRLYSPPSDMTIDRIEVVQCKTDGEWPGLLNGIGPGEYAAHDSDLDQRSWPPQKWRIYEGEQIEIWPIPDQNFDAGTGNGYLKFIGIRKLRPLVDDSDTADLDDRLLVLYAAGGILAAAGAKDANLKIEMANRRLSTLKANLQKTKSIRAFGVGAECSPRRPVISNYRPPIVYG